MNIRDNRLMLIFAGIGSYGGHSDYAYKPPLYSFKENSHFLRCCLVFVFMRVKIMRYMLSRTKYR
jgi:hypothetical protein